MLDLQLQHLAPNVGLKPMTLRLIKSLMLYRLILLRTHSWPRPIKEEVRALIASHGKKKKRKNKCKSEQQYKCVCESLCV